MRTSLYNGLFTSLATNYNRRNKEAKLFELSNIYIPKALPLTELPDERQTLCFGFFGGGDFFDLKGALEGLLDNLGVKGLKAYENKGNIPFLHPGRQAVLTLNNKLEIALLGEVHPDVIKNYSLAPKTYVASVDVQALYELVNIDKKYKTIPKYPAITRDLSMVMKKEIPAGDVEAVITKCGGKLLEHFELFDIYEGEQVGKGNKSLAYTIRFRAMDRTLEDKDVSLVMDKIIEKLREKGIDLRS